MSGLVVVAGYCLSLAAFLGLALWAATVRRGVRLLPRRPVILACLATAFWAACPVIAYFTGGMPRVIPSLAEVIHIFAWLNVLATLHEQITLQSEATGRQLVPSRALVGGGLVMAGLSLFPALPVLWRFAGILGPLISVLGLCAAVAGLVLAEKVYFASGPSGRWGLKYLALGLVTIFVFDFYLYADSLLLLKVSGDIVAARGMITGLVAPLLAISIGRMKSWMRPGETSLNLSRATVMHGVALVGSGLYLLVMAGSAFFVREVGGQWGNSLQIAFLVGGFLVMFVALGSGRFVSRSRIYIHKAFFTYKYDYREEWHRFIRMMSAHQPLSLGERIVHAIANMMDSPSGALWVLQRVDEAFVPLATWNYHGPQPSERADAPFVRYLRDTGWIIETGDHANQTDADIPPLPQWIAENGDAWLVIPLIHRGEVLGILVIDRARAPRQPDWEDRDLLKTAAAHAASYLAEEQASEALRTVQQFEDFNRRFAFVAHDIKNVVGQMSLMLNNAERFGDNPEFQKDMIQTVRNSTERMKQLLEQLSEKRRKPENERARVDLAQVVHDAAGRWRKTAPNVVVDGAGAPLVAMGVRETLDNVIDLLVDNALGALGPGGTVRLRARLLEAGPCIEVQDDGPGMDSDFVRNELFRPLRSTKSSGYGIGAYQTRHMIREMGGQLDVDTAPNRGTTMRIILSLADAALAEPATALRGDIRA